MSTDTPIDRPHFDGYPGPRSNTTYVPNQFFDVVLPHYSRGVCRIVGYMLRRVLGWCDAQGNPREAQIAFHYSELALKAGVGRSMIAQALREAEAGCLIRCVRAGKAKTKGCDAVSGMYELCWDDGSEYTRDVSAFRGFFAGNGNYTHIPDAFFDFTLKHEKLAVVRTVGAIARHSIGFQTKYGTRRRHVQLSFSQLQRYTGLGSRTSLSEAIEEAIAGNHIVRVVEGVSLSGRKETNIAATYALRWADLAEVSVDKSGSGRKVDQGRAAERAEKWTRIGPKSGPRTDRKVDQDRAEKWTNIETTDLNNISKVQQQTAAAATEGDLGMKLLVDVGFDPRTAKQLASLRDVATIEKQIKLLPKRNAKHNQLGLLRQAIVDDWDEPVGNLARGTKTKCRAPKAGVMIKISRERAEEVRRMEPGLFEEFLEEERRRRERFAGSKLVSTQVREKVISEWDNQSELDRFVDYLSNRWAQRGLRLRSM